MLVSTLDESAIGDVEAQRRAGFVPKAELASPRLVELLGPPMSLRVVIAEDQALLRQGIVRLLGDAGFEVVAEAGRRARPAAQGRPRTSPTSRSSTSRCRPTTPTTGCGRRWRSARRQPDVGVLVLSQYAEERYAVDLIGDSAEGVGYLLKDRVTDFTLFADAVRRVAAGGSVLDPTVVAHMLGRRRRDDPLEALTPREREVLELMAEGRSNKGIAEVLVVTPHAVEKHVTSIFSKLGVADRRRGSPPRARRARVPRAMAGSARG